MPEIFPNRTTRMFTRKYLQSISGLPRNHSDSRSLNFFFPSLCLWSFSLVFSLPRMRTFGNHLVNPHPLPETLIDSYDQLPRTLRASALYFLSWAFFPAFTTLFFPSQFLAFSSPLSRWLFSEKPNSVPKISTPRCLDILVIYLISNEHDFYGTSSKREWPQKNTISSMDQSMTSLPRSPIFFHEKIPQGKKV